MNHSRRTWHAAMVAGIVACTTLPGAARAEDRCGTSYTVRTGDTLAAIAERCGTTVEALMGANARIEDPAQISVGWELTVPGARASLGPASEVQAPARSATAEAAVAAGTYAVRPGDSFASIATALRIPMRELMAANRGVDPFGLRPGQTLRIPGADPASSAMPADDQMAEEPPVNPDGQADGSAVREAGGQPDANGAAGHPAEATPNADEAGTEPEAAGSLMLRGQVLNGPECPVLKTPEGDLYSLVSADYGFIPGDYVEIEGEPVDLSFCTEGRATLRVTSMNPVRAPQGG